MAKVDLDKLICSLINEDVAKLRVDPKAAIYDALRAQGLSYKDGAIVEIEPKFKVKKGEWYVCTDTFVSRGKIIAIKGQTYQSQQEDDTITCENKCLFIDRHDGKASDYFRYWTIQDAKDGDVLATSAGAFIYNGNNGGGSCPGSYCGINTLGEFKTGVKHHWTGKKVYPATKEQQDLLFAKMKEAGYMWDANEKKLEKIEQKAADKKENAPEKIYIHPSVKDGEYNRHWLIRKVNQNSVEYVRTDAFIEKACEFLKSYRQYTPDGFVYIAGIVNDKTIEEFRKYMEE